MPGKGQTMQCKYSQGTTSASPWWCLEQAALWALLEPEYESAQTRNFSCIALAGWIIHLLSTSAKNTALLKENSQLQIQLHQEKKVFFPSTAKWLSVPHHGTRSKLVYISSACNSSGKATNTDHLSYCLILPLGLAVPPSLTTKLMTIT